MDILLAKIYINQKVTGQQTFHQLIREFDHLAMISILAKNIYEFLEEFNNKIIYTTMYLCLILPMYVRTMILPP